MIFCLLRTFPQDKSLLSSMNLKSFLNNVYFLRYTALKTRGWSWLSVTGSWPCRGPTHETALGYRISDFTCGYCSVWFCRFLWLGSLLRHTRKQMCCLPPHGGKLSPAFPRQLESWTWYTLLLRVQKCLVSMTTQEQFLGFRFLSWNQPKADQSLPSMSSSETSLPSLSPWEFISHSDIQTLSFHPFGSGFFSLAWRQETNTGGSVLHCGGGGAGGWAPPQQVNLKLGDETGNRCHPWPSVLKHYRPHNQGRSKWERGRSPHKLLYPSH